MFTSSSGKEEIITSDEDIPFVEGEFTSNIDPTEELPLSGENIIIEDDEKEVLPRYAQKVEPSDLNNVIKTKLDPSVYERNYKRQVPKKIRKIRQKNIIRDRIAKKSAPVQERPYFQEKIPSPSGKSPSSQENVFGMVQVMGEGVKLSAPAEYKFKQSYGESNEDYKFRLKFAETVKNNKDEIEMDDQTISLFSKYLLNISKYGVSYDKKIENILAQIVEKYY